MELKKAAMAGTVESSDLSAGKGLHHGDAHALRLAPAVKGHCKLLCQTHRHKVTAFKLARRKSATRAIRL